MIGTVGPFLLVPFLVSDLTDNQWQAILLQEAPSSTRCTAPPVLPIALKYQHEISQKLKALTDSPPVFVDRARLRVAPRSLCADLASRAATGINSYPLERLVSLQI